MSMIKTMRWMLAGTRVFPKKFGEFSSVIIGVVVAEDRRGGARLGCISTLCRIVMWTQRSFLDVALTSPRGYEVPNPAKSMERRHSV
jgi:hypothetical protein